MSAPVTVRTRAGDESAVGTRGGHHPVTGGDAC